MMIMSATRAITAFILSSFFWPTSAQQQTSASRSSIAVGVEFSNNSNHLLIGKAFNRRLAGLDVTYSLALRRNRLLEWNYDVELRPVAFIQDPVSTTTETIQFGSQTPDGPFLLQEGLIPGRCKSSITTIPNGQPGVTIVDTRICGTRWTYAAGLSPLGQRVVFLPRRAIRPYLVVNAGFLASTRELPSPESSAFNFTFAFGGGLAFPFAGDRAISVDYRIHHLSNHSLGVTNPGIDNQVVRLSYHFKERHASL